MFSTLQLLGDYAGMEQNVLGCSNEQHSSLGTVTVGTLYNKNGAGNLQQCIELYDFHNSVSSSSSF